MTPRPLGLADWAPRRASLQLLDQVQQVLVEYATHLPLTLRQIFYRLVGAFSYQKTEQAYERLGELLNRARRAGRIDWEAIRDDGWTIHTPHHRGGPEELVRVFQSEMETLRLDRQQNQRVRLWFAVEAAGMLPQIERIAEPFGITCCSSGGFDSVTAKYGLAEFLADEGFLRSLAYRGSRPQRRPPLQEP